MKQVRKMRLFQKDAYISLDFLTKKAQVVQLHTKASAALEEALAFDTKTGKKWISIKEPTIEAVNAIQLELETFAASIIHDSTPKVSLKDGYEALALAHQIIDDIAARTKMIKK